MVCGHLLSPISVAHGRYNGPQCGGDCDGLCPIPDCNEAAFTGGKMSEIPPWQWPDYDISEIERVHFSRSLYGKPAYWEALAYPCLGEAIDYIWLRPEGTPDLFAICDDRGNATRIRQYIPVEEWQLRTMCSHALEQEKIGRLFFFNDSGQLRHVGEVAASYALIKADGCGKWTSLHEHEDEIFQRQAVFTLFEGRGLVDFMRQPTTQIWNVLRDALNDPHSDASFARDWMNKTEEQCENTVWNWPPNERETRRHELEALLLLALLREDWLWEQKQQWQCSVSGPFVIWLYEEGKDDPVEVPEGLRESIGTIWQRLAPFNQEALRHECASEWMREKCAWRLEEIWEAFTAGANHPSAHERLEAKLQWREWLGQLQGVE